jgi:membrane protease YdiL (CAAX protease family)
MSLFDDNPPPPSEHAPLSISHSEIEAENKPLVVSREEAEAAQPPSPPPPPNAALPGDPFSHGADAPVFATAPQPSLPEDLRVPWSWVHFVVFLIFGFGSLVVVQAGFLLYYAPHLRISSQKELEQILLSKPEFAIGSMVLWYALIFLFLYVTVSVLRGFPFWRSLGWRKMKPRDGAPPRKPWIFFLVGAALSFFVTLLSARIHTPEHIPIEDIYRYRSTALLFMAMAVLLAPLVEETVFRGYLYPLVAKTFGVATGVLVTGLLFGLLHGAQLGWTWGLVSVLILVGVVFTFVRARTGTVFTSYLLHLGYNFTLALFTIIGTRGFTHMPSAH